MFHVYLFIPSESIFQFIEVLFDEMCLDCGQDPTRASLVLNQSETNLLRKPEGLMDPAFGYQQIG